MSGITWSEETLDRFLANPGGLVPGTRMTIAIKDAAQRAALVDYLATLSLSKEITP
jgi:cytochrome c